MIATSRSGSSSRARRVFAGVVCLVAVLGLALTTWVGVRAALAQGHLSEARAVVSATVSDVDDLAAATAALSSAGADTSAARELTADPIWRLAETLPWVGPQLSAVSETAAAIDGAVAAVDPLAAAAAALSLDVLRPVDGAIDVSRIAAVAPAAADAAATLRESADRVDAIDRLPLLGRVSEGVSEAGELLGTAADAADALERATRLVPAMLGADRPRSTLVLLQNNAEWRSLGGVVGAVVQLDTVEGRMTLAAQASSADVAASGDSPVAELPDDVRSIYDTRPARYLQNTTQVPDFSVGAPLAREMWRRVHGTTVDAVVALDPVTLAYLLRATGPVRLPSGDVLTTDNAVPLLLDETYRRYADPRDQDAFFQSASAAVFQALADGHVDPVALVDAVSHSAQERRLLIWNADATEQAVLDGSTLQGALPTSDDRRTTFGVYLNDGTGSKMDYYLHPHVEIAWCTDDTASLHVELRSDAPDPASLPTYVTGGGEYGVPVGDALTGVYVYLPPGAVLVERRTSADGDAPGFAGGVHDERQVVKWSVQLAPGETARLELLVRLARTPELDAVATPTRDGAEVPRIGECRFRG
ncbi:DUF4012 domain-containing protein [Microbacterium sp. VKM Ac-2923]|uniref:DUF4012 domain-containing protein n=1 Tax=Microbacterium sp. VKM Ac-2923 TaxID=2929476 RepID=UPI001FB46220|nr:DUF4012 domain-containing protein [Microbacterium sp. VKM Ac-2923]MCJ1706366.1 DUF4012 domain-containing protein [Microbacterium sp. VKM Ac-2923]